MANKYCNLYGPNKVKNEYGKLNTGFQGVEDDVKALEQKQSELELEQSTYDVRLENVIKGSSEDPNIDAMVLDMKLSPKNGLFDTPAKRLEHLEDFGNASFQADAEKYIDLNTRLDDDYQKDISCYSAATSVVYIDDQRVRIGKQSIRVEEDSASASWSGVIENDISLDLTEFADGSVSDQNDYILDYFYISNLSALDTSAGKGISKLYSNLTPFNTANSVYVNNVEQYVIGTLQTGWNLCAVPKSAFNVVGTGSFSDIKAKQDRWYSKDGYVGEYVSFQLGQLVRKHPDLSEPLYYQLNGIAEFDTGSADLLIVREYGVPKWINTGNTTNAVTGLLSTKKYRECTMTATISCEDGAGDVFALIYYKDASNYIQGLVNDSELRLRVMQGEQSDETVDFQVGIGEIVTFIMRIMAGKATLYAFKNGDLTTLREVSNIHSIDEGKLALGVDNKVTYYSGVSVSQIVYCQNAGLAEYAKNLTVQGKCKLHRASNQSIPSGEITPIIWETAFQDNRAHWSSSDPTRCYAREKAYYDIVAKARFDGNSTGVNRQIYIYKNGSILDIKSYTPNDASMPTEMDIVLQDVPLVVGDYIDVRVLQDTGVNLNLEYIAAGLDFVSLTLSKRS